MENVVNEHFKTYFSQQQENEDLKEIKEYYKIFKNKINLKELRPLVIKLQEKFEYSE